MSSNKPTDENFDYKGANFLKEVEGREALSWVRERNKKTLDKLQADPNFEDFYSRAKNILNAKDKLATGSIRAGYVYNFWQDEKNVRGLWRRTSITDYKKKSPEWETLLDIDELAKKENENWVYKGVSCLPTFPDKCLLTLSRGGKDASVIREFDLNKKEFVEDGFKLPEAKGYLKWVDAEHVLVATDFGYDSLTKSGYPKMLKLWKRGEPLDKAKMIAEVPEDYVSVWANQGFGSNGNHLWVNKYANFFHKEVYYVNKNEDWSLLLVPIPRDAWTLGVFNDRFIFTVKTDWKVGTYTYHAGTVLDFSVSDFIKTGRLPKVHTLFVPSRKEALEDIRISENAVYMDILQDAKSKLLRFQYKSGKWKTHRVKLPKQGKVYPVSVSPSSNQVMFSYESFLKPTQLYISKDTSLRPKLIKSMPAKFNARGLRVKQYFVRSKDGTKVPYFVVSKRRLKKYGENKTILSAYGGFQVSRSPFYNPTLGKLWLEKGGVFVLANIRGGGEYGPEWHKQGLKTNRMRVYEDFFAVSRDLIAKGITTSSNLGISGGSNGGLLVGVAYTKFPELYGAVVCDVPLLDMLEYHKLLAGASWMAEYGDPDIPEERKVLRSYSPFHNLKANVKYPKVFFMTSTKDDRVHPWHARKMAAKMEAFNHPYYYYENIDGGHGGAANLNEYAFKMALRYTYFHKTLVGVEE